MKHDADKLRVAEAALELGQRLLETIHKDD